VKILRAGEKKEENKKKREKRREEETENTGATKERMRKGRRTA
jgi:hypothetical protein